MISLAVRAASLGGRSFVVGVDRIGIAATCDGGLGFSSPVVVRSGAR